MKKEAMFLVYDQNGVPSVRVIRSQNGTQYVNYYGKICSIVQIGYEAITNNELHGGPQKPIYKILGELSIHKTI